MTDLVWPLPPDHPYALSEEERRLMPDGPMGICTVPGAEWRERRRTAIAARRSLLVRGMIVFVPTECEAAVYDLTDTGRQVLALYQAMEGRE